MVAIIYKCRTPFSWNDWDQKKKLLVILMMLMAEEDSVMLKQRIWCRQWLLRRNERGAYHTIFRELAIEDTPGFAEYMRMPYAKFVELAEKISPFIVKQETCIDPSERLNLAIRYLATGETFQSLSFQFQIDDNISDCAGIMCHYLLCVWE